MALLALAADHARAAGYAGIIAATVDHGLRPEAAGEALRVQQACEAIGRASCRERVYHPV